MIELEKICKDKKSIAISSHIRPDGDAFGSSLAMYNHLKKKYPEVKTDIYLIDPNTLYSFLPGFDEIKTEPSDEAYDLVIALDMGEKERLGKNAVLLDNAKETVCIDHHLGYAGIAAEANSYIDTEASSAAELVFDVIGKEEIDDDTAVCIYTGIVCDTGVFEYSNTSRKTMEIAGFLLEFDFDHTKVVNEAFYEKTYRQTLLLGRSLLESILMMDGKVIVSVITQKTLKFYNATSKDLEGIVSQLKHTKGVDVAIFMHETVTGEYKVSLRSNGKVNVQVIASRFGGGGHERASGLTMTGSSYDVINNITAEIEKQYSETEE
ncbi:MAG: bifunctional oligoribonuclease/PAP phosphatase NrnA [Lachnospiraceae bacterium]|nr:bifunctional oligoribonuclease/PAP phosphatase NrnA [Lachnospiraceae bacterium]